MKAGVRTRLRRLRDGVPLNDDYLEALTLTELLHAPAAPLRDDRPGTDAALDVAVVVPAFREGSGGHTTIANLVRGLERRGHRLSLWIDDPGERCGGGPDGALRNFAAWFGPFAAAVHYGFDDWTGADVAVATGWQTVARVRALPGAAARAYLVQDHEPEFFGTSTQRLWAQDSYRHGLYPITAGRWLGEVMQRDYGLASTSFDLGIDTSIYQPLGVHRRSDVVAFYARASTPRRAVPLAQVALGELKRRRPELELWFFGQAHRAGVDYDFKHLGVVEGPRLAKVYARATVGLVLSMTNYSLVPQEMLACGLPCVELDAPSVVAAFGRDGPVDLAPPDPYAIADTLERLLDDLPLRAERSRQGAELVATRTWDNAAGQVQQGLRVALERAAAVPGT